MNDGQKCSFSPQNILVTTVIITLFLGVILAYYTMLYSETRQRIIKSSALSAATSTEQIDRYLSTGIDAIRMASYALDNMIRDGRSQEEILDYLLNQSAAIESITSGSTPGLYGYINGEYLDGTGWVPFEGYDPTERPWYVRPRSCIGRVAVVDPYLDLDSQTIMIALGKTLCDARSVVSMDFSIDHLQTVTEELASQGESTMEIVLDRKFQVIAHSDPSEVGKSYASENDTFGSALVEGVRSSSESYFSLKYDNADYIVYSAPVANNWLCLSVFDATSAFRQLRNTLIFTIVASLLVVSVLLLIMNHVNKKSQIAQQLMENLSQAKNDIIEKDDRIGEISKVAYRDALTGVGSKAAYDQFEQELLPEIAAGRASLSVVMMDVNNLKYINDTFGHDAGDDYLRGCCKIICDNYKHSPVFRVGGDEFVAILQNADYESRETLAAQLVAAFEQSYTQEDVPPQERYSLSAGTADCTPADKTLEAVLKRADKAMYEAKHAFKAKCGSYR